MQGVDLPDRARALLDFWFGRPGDPDRERHREIWFKSTREFDDGIAPRVSRRLRSGGAGALRYWETSAEGALALVLLLDQVPRNIFRGTPRAYASDAAAVGASATERSTRGFRPTGAASVAAVLLHALSSQRATSPTNAARSRCSTALPPKPRPPRFLRRYGHPYIEVIERFGRFPHRNEILGRKSTAEELAFLEECAWTATRRSRIQSRTVIAEPGAVAQKSGHGE